MKGRSLGRGLRNTCQILSENLELKPNENVREFFERIPACQLVSVQKGWDAFSSSPKGLREGIMYIVQSAYCNSNSKR